VNTAYATTLAATGGTAPYTWTVSSGTLPSWASLTASAGVITGTPTAAGTTSFTVKVTDSATQALSITVKAAAPPPTPAAPDYAGVMLALTPSSTGGGGGATSPTLIQYAETNWTAAGPRRPPSGSPGPRSRRRRFRRAPT
jgi:Putative Ig domain